MKSGTQMPRGMLRGCQRRASNLESHSTGVIILMAILRVAKSIVWSTFVCFADLFREKEWWEKIQR